MPLREYSCDACRHVFEEIVSGQERPACPACGGRRLTRRLSSFAVATGVRKQARSDGPGSCGSCGDPRGPGACSAN